MSRLPASSMEKAAASPLSKRPRIALICDFLEENWPSMDLVGDTLYDELRLQFDSELSVTRLRPHMRRRLGRLSPRSLAGMMHNADRLVNRFLDYPHWLQRRTSQFDVFHIIDHSYAQLAHVLPGERTLITCHDLDAFRCLLQPEREARPAWFRALARRTLEGLSKAAHVICVTKTIRDELIGHRLLPSDRVHVVPNGVHPAYSALAHSAADRTAQRLVQAAGTGPVLLNVGIPIPRKRLDVLIRVFAEVRRQTPDAFLVRVGGPLTATHSQLIRELGLEGAVTSLPFLEKDVLAAIFRRATLLLQTSEAEGFGLPVVEALACGCPVVASDIPVFREIAADSVTYCEVANITEWTVQVQQLLKEHRSSPSAWAARRRRGCERASHFSWAESARQTALMYQKILLPIS